MKLYKKGSILSYSIATPIIFLSIHKIIIEGCKYLIAEYLSPMFMCFFIERNIHASKLVLGESRCL